ncbi:hypothetical protein QNI16_34740 [Cytophagaceae bacterium YF14B1]|uniref:Disease resistance R13L4/SHOC-2-like LRR domain-containing protein n=1 Tax=Xanthocytophaga flava TaxID=3048013 RepID=A0AAE3QY41_9BACT|nr:leucine-rich repeat domain-containing protein [Xanthocytophaga flavus]MDJ1485690.1 hypothetical protein [Xanthocytophaga flavus]
MLKSLKSFIHKLTRSSVSQPLQKQQQVPQETQEQLVHSPIEQTKETSIKASSPITRSWVTYNGYPEDLEGGLEMTQNLIRLIASNDDANIELAFQMLKGLKHPVVKHMPVNASIEKKKLWLKLAYDQITIQTYDRWNTNFDLSHCYLTKLPPTIGSLLSTSRYSTSLNLNHNLLEDLPFEFFYYKDKHVANAVQSISLAYNRFRYFPEALLKQEGLRKIDINHNQITTLPRRLEDLRQLESLYAGFNQLTQLPDTIGNIKHLSVLFLPHNYLQTLPDSIGGLEHLRLVNLSHNYLQKLPFGLTKSKSLRILNLYINQLTQWPDTLNEIQLLREINLSFNQIKKANLRKLSQLKRLFLVNNQLEELYIDLNSLPKLTKLHLHNNQLKQLPENIGVLKRLKELRVYNNQLESIPDSIGNLEYIHYLSLNKNRLTTLPDSIQNLKRLKQLDLQDNLFSEQEINRIKRLLPHTLIHF